ncbi:MULTISPECIES: hypothetical protein [unclassified Carboxylicivirga]|uniref:hypothetical protein n=1 Tax=Carboxylicivirga TaxID=1628153 RepID=UPI003D33EFB6
MENLKQQEQIINLGKLFVKELKLEPGVDTFSRWMAHYLAEKITLAEQSEGQEKATLNKECFEIILKLWEHRNSLPSGNRPFQNFEPIIEFLSKLNMEREHPLFFNSIPENQLDDFEKNNLDYESVKDWTNIAKEIDKTAKIWIEFALGQAANKAANERTKEWIDNAVNMPESADSSIISKLVDLKISFDDKEEMDDFSKKYAIEKLKDGISRLQKFDKLNKLLIETYELELNKALKE